MATVELDDDLVAILDAGEEPVERVAVELIVLHLYWRGTISGDKATELLGVSGEELRRRASSVGFATVDAG